MTTPTTQAIQALASLPFRETGVSLKQGIRRAGAEKRKRNVYVDSANLVHFSLDFLVYLLYIYLSRRYSLKVNRSVGHIEEQH